MNLKDILVEATGHEKEARKLHTLLQEDYVNGMKNLLYRGYNESIDTYKVKNIRKDRKPSDTPRYLQRLVDEMTEDYDAIEIPKRRESKFASAKKVFASSFGQPYICFPEKNATIVSSKYDTWEHTLARVESLFKTAVRDLKHLGQRIPEEPEDFPELVRAIKLLKKAKKVESLEEVKKVVEELWKFYRDNESEIKHQSKMSGIEEFADAFSMIEVHYLGNFDEVIGEGDEEVMFDGDTYLLVDPEFFDRYFKWDRMYGSWKIKSKYR